MAAKEGVPPDKLEKKKRVVKKNRSSCMFNLQQVVYCMDHAMVL